MTPIAHIHSLYGTKFGVPRQAGLVDVPARIVFEPEYRVAEALRGIEQFDYLWLIWQFHLAERSTWSPTVRPPRLGGNKRVGVFASRSPFRPNPIGLSSVKLIGVETDPQLGPVLVVGGADLVDGTPILDIKPYVPYADSHPDASGGYASEAPVASLAVEDPQGVLQSLPPDRREALRQTLACDPRPHYQDDPQRIYSMLFGSLDVKFRVEGDRLIVLSTST